MFNLFVKSIYERRIDTICFNLILFDIFFLPLFPWFSVSISLPIIIYWYLTNRRKVRFLKESRYFGIIVVLMVISTLFSFLDFGDLRYETTFSTSVKRFFQYLFSFWYFFFFLYFFSKYKRNISNIIFWGIIVIACYALIYSFNQELFFNIKKTLCPFDPQIFRADTVFIYRYNFLWADPNNVAYASTGLVSFFIIESKGDIIRKYISILCLLFILLCTMSIGGICIAIVTIGYIVCFSKGLRQGKISLVNGLVVIFLLMVLVIQYGEYFVELYNNGLGKRQDLYGGSGISGGGGREEDFINGLGKLNPIFLVAGSGQEGFVTEIGHIYLLCLYGLPVYIYFMYILFGKRKKQTFLEYISIIPFFVGFTMNIAIGEQKFLLMLLLISAYYAARNYNLKPFEP